MSIEIYVTRHGMVIGRDGAHRQVFDADFDADLDVLLRSPDVHATATSWFDTGSPSEAPTGGEILAPIHSQEVWAAGVTYLRSRVARSTESRDVGADRFYDMVYEAERPELFFKATPHRVAGHLGDVRIRGDSTWDVPEPELVLVIDAAGKVVGHTIGNDMSSRSIEGANPLYLPQAKVYAGCAALGPKLVLADEPLAPTTEIVLEIVRGDAVAFAGTTAIDRISRSFDELVEHLFRDNEFPYGVFLMTGTGIVPPDDFTLHHGDEVRITIEPIGTLVNHVVRVEPTGSAVRGGNHEDRNDVAPT